MDNKKLILRIEALMLTRPSHKRSDALVNMVRWPWSAVGSPLEQDEIDYAYDILLEMPRSEIRVYALLAFSDGLRRLATSAERAEMQYLSHGSNSALNPTP